MSTLRISVVQYLNSVPLIWGMLHGPQQGKHELQFATPAHCADAVRDGTADIGIIPAIEYHRVEDLQIISGIAIASKSRVRSVLLLSRVPIEEIREGIRHGVRKVNIDTDIRLAMTAAMRRTMKKSAREIDPRKFLQAAMEETKKVCMERFEAFGAAGQAVKIRPIALEAMASRYQAGELNQIIH